MAVNLNEMLTTIPEIAGGTGTIKIKVLAGTDIKIETTPGGEDVAQGTVPDGKVWDVKFVITIMQSDA